MNFLQTVPRSPWCPIQNHLDTHGRRRISRTSIAPFSTFDNLGMPSTCFYRKSAMNRPPELKISVNKGTVGRQIPFLPLSKSYPSIIHSQVIQSTTGVYIVNAYSGSSTETSGAEKIEDEKSEIYSTNMTEAMGAVLTYRHELGMNYNFIRPDLIVGSCLQTPADVDKLRKIGVKTVFCLQQDSDLEYFGVDINAIREYAEQYNDIEHLRAEIRDFDAFDLRMRLPSVVSKLYKAINRNGGVTYVHCTAGLGRAPAVTLAYMFWVQGYKLSEANKLLQSKRSCFPKLEAVKSATADILTGLAKNLVTLKWKGHNCSSVEISGLDIGWGQKVPLKFDKEKKHWVLERELPEGCYEYKYIVDGEWTCEMDELVTLPNKDGHVNNYINVDSSSSDDRSREMRKRLMNDNVDLTKEERSMILRFLEACQDDD